MQLLLIRHGVTVDRVDFARAGHPDEVRPLSPEGQRRLVAAVKGLRKVHPDLAWVFTSPLLRARQTAQAVAKRYGAAAPIVVQALAPKGSYPEILERVRASRGTCGALVGHEPDLTRFGCWLLTGSDQSFLCLRKAGACLIELPGKRAPRHAVLRWVLTPRQLRRLGRA